MVLGTQIRKAREAKRWKQKDLAARVYVEPQTISNWERGVRVPDWDKLEILARELEQPLSYFVSEDATPDPAVPAEAEGIRELRVLVDALLEDRGLDPDRILRDARLQPGAPEREVEGLPVPDEAAGAA